jgi:hypothetical protein
MDLSFIADSFAVCRLAAGADIPAWALLDRSFVSITYTADELSIVCPLAYVPAGVPAERHWMALKVEGPLDLELTGILASLVAPLAAAGISLFAISTFDTDYLLIKEQHLAHARQVLEEAGHRFV